MIFMPSLQRNKQQTIKHRIFRFHHQILTHYQVPNQLYFILIIIQTFQMMHYAVHQTNNSLWPTSLTITMQKIFSAFQLVGLWQSIGDIALFIFLILMFAMYSICLGFILYEVLKNSQLTKQTNIIAVKFVSYTCLLTKTILLMPTIHACLSFIESSHPFNNFQIGSSLLIPISIISVPTLILLCINMVDFTLFVRQNSPFSKLPFTSSVNDNQEIRTLIKTIMAVYGSIFLTSSSLGIVFCFMVLVMNLFYLLKIYQNSRILTFPYSFCIQLGPVLVTWLCVSSLLQQTIYPSQQIGLLFCIIGLLVIPFVWIQIMKYRSSEIMYSNYKFITSPNELIYYNYYAIQCVNHLQSPGNLIYLEGILNYHISQCKKSVQNCSCFKIRSEMNKFTLERQKSELLQEKKMWFTFIKENLMEIKEKYKNVAEISLLLSYIERDQLSNKFRALHNLEEPSHFTSGLKFQFLNYHFLRQIQMRMLSEDKLLNQKKLVDVNKFYEFEMQFGKLEQAIQESTYQHLSFWSNLSSQRTSKQKIIQNGNIITKKVEEVKEIYQKLISINPFNLYCLVTYANYMKIIVNNPETYQKNYETIKNIKKSLLNASKLSTDPQKQKYGENSVTGIIIISGQRQNIGVVKHCNTKITQLIKYAPHQLLGQNINVLMPKFIGSMHDDILMSYLEMSESKYDSVQRLAPMIDKDNYLVFVRILTKPLPSLMNGLQLVGIFNLISQFHINHPGQAPKYVLFRADSGQIQSLSQTCDSQFNYRINKIDENHETSSQLTFDSLFEGVKQNQLSTSDQSVKTKIKVHSEQNETKQIGIQVYLRHQIFYFGVKLKLLYFFTLKSYNNLNGSDAQKQDQGNRVFKKIMIQQEEAEAVKKYNQNDNKKQFSQEKKLKQYGKKLKENDNRPISLKIFTKGGIFFFLVIFLVNILLVCLDMAYQNNQNNYMQFSKVNLKSQEQLTQVNFYSRAMHLSHYYPTQMPFFQHYQSNISKLTSSLQNNQFQIVNTVLNTDGLAYGDYTLQWKTNQQLQISNSTTTLDINIFDYITSASHFQSTLNTSLNFNLNMMSSPTNSNAYMELFNIRYSGLFQTIPKKEKFHIDSANYFKGIVESQNSSNTLQMSLILTGIFILLFVFIPLVFLIEKTIHHTIMLFGHMHQIQIQKEINNCNNFLEIFFKDSYRVKLNKTNNYQHQFSRSNTFCADDIKLGALKGKEGGSAVFDAEGKQKGFTSMNSQYEVEPVQRPRRGSILQSTQRIQALQQEFNNRTNKEIESKLGEKQDQKQSILQKSAINQNYDEQESIYQKLEKTKDYSKYFYILILVLIHCILASYFIAKFTTDNQFSASTLSLINNYRMMIENVNLMKKVKLYAIQSVIENQKFATYPLLSVSTANYVLELYAHQRAYNQFILSFGDNITITAQTYPILEIFMSDLCSSQALDYYVNLYDKSIYPKSSFTTQQCQSIQNGILTLGLRPSMVAFTQILSNYTTQPHTIDDMAKGDKFQSIMKMQKYLQAPQTVYASQIQSYINQSINKHISMQISLFLVMLFGIILIFFLVWYPLNNKICEKLASTTKILSLIPTRVFIKNSTLAKQYQKYVSSMME